MIKRLPGWVTRHGAEHDEAERAEYASMPIDARWRRLAQLSRLSARLLAANEHRREVLELRDERSVESLATWRKLMERRRG